MHLFHLSKTHLPSPSEVPCSCEEAQGSLPITCIPAMGPTPSHVTWEVGFQSTITTRWPLKVNKATAAQTAFQGISSCPFLHTPTVWDAQRDSWQRQWTKVHWKLCVRGGSRARALYIASGLAAAFTLQPTSEIPSTSVKSSSAWIYNANQNQHPIS